MVQMREERIPKKMLHTKMEGKLPRRINTKKYHVFAPMGRFQLESIYLYFPPSSQLLYNSWDDSGK